VSILYLCGANLTTCCDGGLAVTKFSKSRVSIKLQREVPLFLEIPVTTFPYRIVGCKEASVPKTNPFIHADNIQYWLVISHL